MSKGGETRTPDLSKKGMYDTRYAAFLKMHTQRRELDALLAN